MRVDHTFVFLIGLSAWSVLCLAQSAPVDGFEKLYLIESASGSRRLGYMDEKGNVLIPPRFSYAQERCMPGEAPNCTLFWAVENGKGGYINSRGSWEIAPEFDSVAPIGEKRGPVRKGAEWFFIDLQGRRINSKSYDWIYPYVGGRALTCLAGLCGYIDHSSRLAPQRIGAAKKMMPIVSEGVMAYEDENGKVGMMDLKGKPLSPGVFDEVWQCHDGLCPVRQLSMWGFADTRGTIVIAPQFSSVDSFREGLAPASKDGKFGFIDSTGKFAIAQIFDNAKIFSRGLAAVQYRGKWGYVETSGNFRIPPSYSEADPFWRPLARVRVNGFSTYIDDTGKVVWSAAPPSPPQVTTFMSEASPSTVSAASPAQSTETLASRRTIPVPTPAPTTAVCRIVDYPSDSWNQSGTAEFSLEDLPIGRVRFSKSGSRGLSFPCSLGAHVLSMKARTSSGLQATCSTNLIVGSGTNRILYGVEAKAFGRGIKCALKVAQP